MKKYRGIEKMRDRKKEKKNDWKIKKVDKKKKRFVHISSTLNILVIIFFENFSCTNHL
jgi:hypothetical protein